MPDPAAYPLSSALNPDKETTAAFNPRDKRFRRKFWVQLQSAEGGQVYIFWRRILALLVILAVGSWLGLSAAAWGFVKYQRKVADVAFTDIAFYPWRAQHYRETLSTHYLVTAQAHLQNGAWSKAVFNLRLSLAKNRDQREARRLLAEIYSQIQRDDLAIKLLADGLPEAKDDTDYLQKLFVLLRRNHEQPRIIELGEQLLPTQPDDQPVHQEIVYQVAQARLDLKQGDLATKLLTQWHLASTRRGQLFLSDVENAQGYPELAMIRLERLYQAEKNDQIIIKLVILYRQLGRLEEARQIAFQRVFLKPNSAGARIDLIVLFHETHDPDAMQREFISFLKDFAEDRRALAMLSSVVINFPRPDLAIQVRETAPKDDQGYPAAIFQIAVMQAQCTAGQFPEALETGNSLERYPHLNNVNQANINLMRAWANYGLNENLKGDSWFSLAISEDNPAMLQDAFLLVHRLEEIDRPEAVRRVLVALVSHSQGNPLPLITLARYDIAAQDWSRVPEYLPDLFKLDPLPTELLKTISHSVPTTVKLSPELQAKLDLYY